MKYSLKKGFTLVEILISTAVVILIMLVLYNIYTGYDAVFVIQQARVEVNGSAREVVDEFKHTALQASQVVTSHAFSGENYTSGSDEVVFRLPAIDGTGAAIAGRYDYIAFFATSTSVYKVTEAGAGSARGSGTRRLSDTLNTLVFTYNNVTLSSATSTEIDIQTQKTVQGQLIQAHLHESARLRNI
ncbi:type II secretion system protein [Candidatus Kaiserbacteria bacterium]|nr:type II secretion system protein [Candidatus Kaiserbacteria bacterium]